MVEHLIDPLTLLPGDSVRFECSEPDCNQGFWHAWLPDDAQTYWGERHCYMHGTKKVLMRIVAAEKVER